MCEILVGTSVFKGDLNTQFMFKHSPLSVISKISVLVHIEADSTYIDLCADLNAYSVFTCGLSALEDVLLSVIRHCDLIIPHSILIFNKKKTTQCY